LAGWKKQGCHCQGPALRMFQDDDHFLFFRQREEVLRIVAEMDRSAIESAQCSGLKKK